MPALEQPALVVSRGLTQFALLLALLLAPWQVLGAGLEVRGHSINHDTFTVVALPGESLRIGLPLSEAELRLSMDGQQAGRVEQGNWLLDAPSNPGLYRLTVEGAPVGEVMLNLFVMVPAEQVSGGYLNGYRMGDAPPGHSKHPDLYRPPRGFIEVTAENVDTPLTPHFTLRQFLCKQDGDYPKYLALQESLLVLLEGLLQAVVEAGYPAQTFGVISGYRTPWYNKYIGNVPNSRHVYGDAMDLYLDLDGDGAMDDLDGDNSLDRDDVNLLADIAEAFMNRPANAALAGGIGRYGKTSRHGGFVHVDTRGYRARW
jgi:hypothetical protein